MLVVVLLFGTKKLRNLGGDLGGAVRGFKQGMKEATQEDNAAGSGSNHRREQRRSKRKRRRFLTRRRRFALCRMFGISFGEILLIVTVGLIIVGPKRLPERRVLSVIYFRAFIGKSIALKRIYGEKWI